MTTTLTGAPKPPEPNKNMTSQSSSSSSGGIGVLGLLGCIFVTLKLCGVIDWSWWWVTAPFWGGFALVLAIFLVVFGIAALAAGFGGIAASRRRSRIGQARRPRRF